MLSWPSSGSSLSDVQEGAAPFLDKSCADLVVLCGCRCEQESEPSQLTELLLPPALTSVRQSLNATQKMFLFQD